MDNHQLIKSALKAREHAYAPYSHFAVGAAVLTKDGQVYTGCNIENASYGATNCAERTAIFKAVSDGSCEFVKVAIVGGKVGDEITEYAYPCGVCRQVMAEFCDGEFLILVVEDAENYQRYTLSQLLPRSFDRKNIVT